MSHRTSQVQIQAREDTLLTHLEVQALTSQELASIVPEPHAGRSLRGGWVSRQGPLEESHFCRRTGIPRQATRLTQFYVGSGTYSNPKPKRFYGVRAREARAEAREACSGLVDQSWNAHRDGIALAMQVYHPKNFIIHQILSWRW